MGGRHNQVDVALNAGYRGYIAWDLDAGWSHWVTGPNPR